MNALNNIFFKNGQGRLALINGRPAYAGMNLKVFGQDCPIISAKPQGVGFRYTVLTPEGKAVELSAKDIAAWKAAPSGDEGETVFEDKNDWASRVLAWSGLRIESGADGVDRAVTPGDVIVGEYGPHYHLFLESYVRDVVKLDRVSESGFSPAEVADMEALQDLTSDEEVEELLEESPFSAEDESELRAALLMVLPAVEEVTPKAEKVVKASVAAVTSFDGMPARAIQAMAEYAGLDSVSPKYEELIRKQHPTEQERQLLCKKLKESGYIGAREQAGRTFPVYKDDTGVTAKTVPNAKAAGLKDRGDAVAVYLRAATNPAELTAALKQVAFPDLAAALAQYSHLSFGLLKMSMTNRLRKLVATGVVSAASLG
jgi:hypothetical protein